MNYAEQIQAVINTIGTIEVRATYDNMNKLYGIHQVLAVIRDGLRGQREDDEDAGETDAK